MATSLNKLENKVQIHHLHVKSFHMVKRLRKSVQYIRRYSTKYASFFGSAIPDVHKWALTTLELLERLSKIFTRYRGIICVVNAHIEVVISHFVSECQSDESAEFAIFSQNWLPWKRPLRYHKKRYRAIICTQNAFIRWKDCENRSGSSWYYCSPRNH